MEDKRPTTDVVLPGCQAVVTMFNYLRNGDIRTIQRRISDAMEYNFSESQTPEGQSKVDVKVSPSAKVQLGSILDEEDFTLELLIKSVKDEGNNQIDDIKVFIYNLSPGDAGVLYKKSNELSRESQLSEDQVKK